MRAPQKLHPAMGSNCCTTTPVVASVRFREFERKLPPLSGKRIAITGATSGMGRVVALTCLKKGAEVFMLNRESRRAQDVLQDFQNRSAALGGKVTHIPCDLQDFSSVREAACRLSVACQGQLDVLCNNAGIVGAPLQATNDGFCLQMQTNHLSHFLLTCLMMPALLAAGERHGDARVVSHASMYLRGRKMDRRNYGENFMAGDSERFYQSKLANILFTHELADRLAGTGIKAMACTPGLAATNLFAQQHAMRLISCFAGLIGMQSAEDGAKPLLACIAGLDVKSGDFFIPCTALRKDNGLPKALRRFSGWGEYDDPESRKAMWILSENAVSQEFEI